MAYIYFINVFPILFLFSLFLYHYFTKTFNYWKHKGIKYKEPRVIFGNVKEVLLGRINMAQGIQQIYNKYPEDSYVGIYLSRKPILLIRDPDLIKRILVQDFHHFPDRGITNNQKSDPLSENLFDMQGEKWRRLRDKLTPAFSSGKLKSLFPLLIECGNEINLYVKDSLKKGNVFDISDLTTNYTIEVMGSCIYGVDINFSKNPNSEFKRMGLKLFQPNITTTIKRYIRSVTPALYRKLKMKVIPSDIENFFMGVVEMLVKTRKESGAKRGDFLQILIDLQEQMSKTHSEKSSFEFHSKLLATQLFSFFAAGFETSAATISFCLYELALNQEIQKRVQKTIDEVLERHGGKLSYEAVLEMEYLDQTICETMRKYSPVGNLLRKCNTTYAIPGTKVVLNQNDSVMIPVHALHHDPSYFPDPDKFQPERFSKEGKESRPRYCFLPFGEGQRICIGLRLGKLQTMVGLIAVLKDFTASPCKETEIPLTFKTRSLVLAPKNGIYLTLESRHNE